MAPPPKRRWLRILLILLVFGVLLLGLAVPLLRWRTEVAWRKFQKTWEQKGERFELASLRPDPVPDEQNLAHHPLFVNWESDSSEAALWFDQIDSENASGYVKKSSRANPALLQPGDFSAWEDLAEGLTQEQRLAEIQRRFEPLNDPLDQVAAALRERPVAHFPVDWNAGLAMATSHLFEALRVSDAFLVRANLSLQSGQPAAAIDDLLSVHDLAGAIGQDRYLIALLVELAIRRAALPVLWEGLSKQVFSPGDLARVDAKLAAIEPLGPRSLMALRIERAFLLTLFRQIRAEPAKYQSGDLFGKGLGKLASGWFYAHCLMACKDLQELLLAPGGTLVTRPELADALALDQRLAQRTSRPSHYLYALALILHPQAGKVVSRTLHVEAELINARLAIALERHRLADGDYPPDLAALLPRFLSELPVDLINDRPIEYRLQSDGTPLLYQWGCNGQDDKGRPRKDPMFGDIVWQYTRDQPLSETEWLRQE